jgi:hypothetical protein
MNMGPRFFSGKEEKPETGLFEYGWTHVDVVTALQGGGCQGRWMMLVRKYLIQAVQNQAQLLSVE